YPKRPRSQLMPRVSRLMASFRILKASARAPRAPTPLPAADRSPSSKTESPDIGDPRRANHVARHRATAHRIQSAPAAFPLSQRRDSPYSPARPSPAAFHPPSRRSTGHLTDNRPAHTKFSKPPAH